MTTYLRNVLLAKVLFGGAVSVRVAGDVFTTVVTKAEMFIQLGTETINLTSSHSGWPVLSINCFYL